MITPPLNELINMAKEHYQAMTPEQKDKMQQKQCKSRADEACTCRKVDTRR